MDLNLDTEWNDIFKRWGLLIRIWSWLREYSYSKMILDRTIGNAPYMTLAPADEPDEPVDMKEDGPTLVANAVTLAITGLPVLSNWDLSGIKFDSNTDANGTIYVKALTDAYGTGIAVYLYKDVDEAEEDLVASGSGSAEETIELSQYLDSGISGTVYAGDFSGAVQEDQYYLRCRPDWKRRLQQSFETGSAEDAQLLSTALDKLSDNADTIDDMISDWEDFIETEFIETYLKTKMQSVSDDVLSVSESQSGGTVTVTYEGVLADLKANMEDDTTHQTVRKNTPTASGLSESPNNPNVGSATASITLYDHAKSGKVVLKCLDATIGSEYFEVKWVPDNWWEFDDLTGTYYAYVDKTYIDNAIGIKTLTISRDIEELSDVDNKYSVWVISGETSANTNDGVLYSKYYQDVPGDTGTIKIYKSTADRDGDSNEVASGAVTVADLAKSIDLTEQNSSGLSGNVTIASEPSDNYEANIDLNLFTVDDVLTFTITEVKTGLIQKYVGDVYNFDLPFAPTPGEETIADYYARRG